MIDLSSLSDNSYDILMFFLFLIIPIIFTFASMPYIIPKLKKKGQLVKDMYKLNTPDVPTNGGLIILLISLFSLSILSLFYGKFISSLNYTIIVVIVLFAFFGLVDDMINIGRPAKLILLYYCSYPLIPFILATSIYFPIIGSVEFSAIYPQIIIVTYVPVVANLINMHSGLNGLAPGLSLIILITLILKAFFFGDLSNALFAICLSGALIGYFWFEKYPSRIFWGNIGALSVGAAIGTLIVTQGFIISGFIMLIPHTVNFLLYVYWKLNIHKYPIKKFGYVSEDRTLKVPNPLTLKWVMPYYFKMTEKSATYSMFALTAVFCIIGFYFPK
jgi:UDP-N-acetylglucosamine--dolichyl-phosphate N-acetylglucosaminephosphotransferase